MLRLLFLYLASVALAFEYKTVKRELEKVINDVQHRQCHIFRKAHSLLHNQARTETTPLETMTLQYRDVGVHNIYNITSAAKQILNEQEFNSKQKLCVLVHGYDDNPDRVFYKSLIETLLSQGECKVLQLNASELVRPSYFRTVKDVRFIGDKVAEVLADMVKMGVDESAIHIMGGSLGSHIIGYIGKGFTKRTGSKVGRITAFDPSGECFRKADPDMRLDANDAEFVDVIYTDERIGIYYPIGQANYYPNGGTFQPNCVDDVWCSHVRVIYYFIESVRTPDAFLALKCKDWESFKRNQCEGDISPMGIASEPGTTGNYYLRTGSVSPFGLGKGGIKWEEGNFGNGSK